VASPGFQAFAFEFNLCHRYFEAQKAAFGPLEIKRTRKGKKGKNAQILVEGSGEKPKRARTVGGCTS
jgi:hypothetical protein